MIHRRSRNLPALLTGCALFTLASLQAGCARPGADEPAPEAHDPHASHVMGGAAAIGRLALDGGRKWATDEPLRAGMAAIRAAFDAGHTAIDSGSATDAQYEALAGRVDAEVQDIIRHCRLPPAADANLHLIIADLQRGAHEMRGGDPARARRDGAVLVHGALGAYGRFFDDPAWSEAAARKP